MATLALIGATGFVGGAVLNEALARGHQVRALARHPFKLATRPRLEVVQADVLVPSQVILGLHCADAVISAYNSGWKNPEQYDEFLQATRALYAGARHAGVKRLLVVGGAGSLFVAPGVQLVDTPQFPAHIKPGALAARDALELLRAEYSLDWTFLSPPPLLLPQDRQGHGERTGSYRVGEDAPLAGTKATLPAFPPPTWRWPSSTKSSSRATSGAASRWRTERRGVALVAGEVSVICPPRRPSQ